MRVSATPAELRVILEEMASSGIPCAPRSSGSVNAATMPEIGLGDFTRSG